jgi:hypothetical protein
VKGHAYCRAARTTLIFISEGTEMTALAIIIRFYERQQGLGLWFRFHERIEEDARIKYGSFHKQLHDRNAIPGAERKSLSMP